MRRQHNEDAFTISNQEGYGIVCDGMGGHQCGEVASRLAVEIISRHASAANSRLVASSKLTFGQLRQLASDQVIEWTKDANIAIYQRGSQMASDGTKRMGTTLVLMLLVDDYVVLAHVGDSRIYRLRGGRLERMTEDHTTRVRGPSRRDNTKLRVKKYVTRALGTRPTVEPAVRIEVVQAGDLFLLCSDGLTDLVREKEIERLLGHLGDDTATAARALIHLANKRGGSDNVTVVLGEIRAPVSEDDDEDTADLAGLIPRKPKPSDS